LVLIFHDIEQQDHHQDNNEPERQIFVKLIQGYPHVFERDGHQSGCAAGLSEYMP